jgi:glycosyltransferase involved in cell wall biosynthesis
MRIIHLVKHCEQGNGNAYVAIDLACVQSTKGHSVIYASGGGFYQGLLAAQGVGLERIDQSGHSLASVFKSATQLVRLCKNYRPDIIHAHMMSSAVFGYIASLATGVPLITTVHNSFDRHSVLMRLGRIAVAVSKAEKQQLEKRGFNPRRLATVLNGPNKSPRETWNSQNEQRVFCTPSVIMVCGLHHRKGVDTAIQAFSRLHSDFPEWHLNIAGEGPDRAKLEALAEGLGASGFIHFLGFVFDPRPLLRKSAIYLSASYAEPCGLSIAEARDVGCAIVATAVGGTPELLEQGKAGRMVPPGDPEALGLELRRLMSDPDELQTWQARSKAGADYLNVFRLAEDYERVYDSVRRL